MPAFRRNILSPSSGLKMETAMHKNFVGKSEGKGHSMTQAQMGG
jgi:hypothetical protein